MLRFLMRRRLHIVTLWHHEPLWAELWSGVGMILWSKWLYWGSVDLERQDNYRYITSLVTDDSLEAIGFVLGLLQLSLVLFDQKWGRTAMAFFAALFWMTLAHSLWLGNASAPGSAAYLTLGLQNLASVALIRLRPRADA